MRHTGGLLAADAQYGLSVGVMVSKPVSRYLCGELRAGGLMARNNPQWLLWQEWHIRPFPRGSCTRHGQPLLFLLDA